MWYVTIQVELNPRMWRLSWWENTRAAEGVIEFGPFTLTWYFP